MKVTELLTGYKNLSQKTLSAYNSDLKQFFDFENDVLRSDICSFILYLNSNLKLKDSSIRRKIITLKNFYDYLSDKFYRYLPF